MNFIWAPTSPVWIAGLKVSNGIAVNGRLATSDPYIYAAGDAAAFFQPALGRTIRVEHEDNANTMGRQAGRAMTGEAVSFDHLSMFYSDLFDYGYEAVGDVSSDLEMVEDWREPYREGIVYYLRDGQVVGVLLWNVWEQVEAARALVKEKRLWQSAEVCGALPA